MWTYANSSDIDRPIRAIKHDQLTHEMQGGYTMHHLREGTVNFKPTYKFEPGHTARYSHQVHKKAWCDRILYASSSKVTVEAYQSVMAFTSSDHKPVSSDSSYQIIINGAEVVGYLPINFQVSAVFRLTDATPTRLDCIPPFASDILRARKKRVGRAGNLLVGLPWTVVRMAGFGSDPVGIAVIIVFVYLIKLFLSHFWF